MVLPQATISLNIDEMEDYEMTLQAIKVTLMPLERHPKSALGSLQIHYKRVSLCLEFI